MEVGRELGGGRRETGKEYRGREGVKKERRREREGGREGKGEGTRTQQTMV